VRSPCPFCAAPGGAGKEHGCPNLWCSCWRCGRVFDVVEMLAIVGKYADRRHHVPKHPCKTGPVHGPGSVRAMAADCERLDTLIAHVKFV